MGTDNSSLQGAVPAMGEHSWQLFTAAFSMPSCQLLSANIFNVMEDMSRQGHQC
jgi:hypothetical protein